MTTTSTIVHEPFIARFTGQLSVVSTKSGHTCTFKKPYPRIEKDRHYMLTINTETGQCRFLSIAVPEWV